MVNDYFVVNEEEYDRLISTMTFMESYWPDHIYCDARITAENFKDFTTRKIREIVHEVKILDTEGCFYVSLPSGLSPEEAATRYLEEHKKEEDRYRARLINIRVSALYGTSKQMFSHFTYEDWLNEYDI